VPDHGSENQMKLPVPLALVLVASVIALGAFFSLRSYTDSREQKIHDLQAATDVQIEVLAPLLQKYKLGSGIGTTSKTFSEFLSAQVAAGKLPEAEAKQALATISAAGQGEPVLTSRGWVMPVIAGN